MKMTLLRSLALRMEDIGRSNIRKLPLVGIDHSFDGWITILTAH